MNETPKHTPGPWSYAINGEERIPGYPPMTIYKADKTDLISQHEGGYYDYVAISEADARLIAAAPDMLEALKIGRRAIGEHHKPTDCYATGPVTGNHFADLVQCPACLFIQMYDDTIAKAEGRQP
jgi:N12 class adenine-specific DNA methylase